MQVNDNTVDALSDREAQKKLVEELKVQWKLLWSERFDDKIRAEGVSVDDYVPLKVQRGTIIHATRDFKALNFKDILEQNKVENAERFIQPDARVGGWRKFVRSSISNQGSKRTCGKRASEYVAPKKQIQQVKKGGRGWLHMA